MRLRSIELSGFKSFAKKTQLEFSSSITAIVGPNGSGKSNIAESFRFVLGEQSMKSMRGKRGEDMIWNGSAAVPRAGRASVKLVFDNTDRALKLDFDEVAIERVVHRDGGNEYLLNGSTVRLRDIVELLSHANIGASGHHIISQGEADRILSASPRERREMIEDALGLTGYLYKREEAERKLEKTAENMREVESLRRELAPHLKYLQAQVKKIEDSQKLRDQLLDSFLDYFKRESVYLRIMQALLAEEKSAPEHEHKTLGERIAHLRRELDKKKDDGSHELVALEKQGRDVTVKRSDVLRDLGRIEGELALGERLSRTASGAVPAEEARQFAERIEKELQESLSLESATVKNRLSALIVLVKEFLRRLPGFADAGEQEKHAKELATKKAHFEKELAALQATEDRIAHDVAVLRKKMESEKDESRSAERELFAAMAHRSELETILAGLRAQEESLARARERLKFELGEAGALVGKEVGAYEEHEVRDARHERISDAEIADESRAVQEDRRKKLERMKIRLEESGAGDSHEVLKEFGETTERDAFLARELHDLAASAESLRHLIEELTSTLTQRFQGGVQKVSAEFDTYFKILFDGGSASLSISAEEKIPLNEDEKPEVEQGVEVAISLPHKRVKSLHMLSGGERALTAIALIFAMSQVNPPPFLILDETDAALDEANSRRYGNMVETLAKHSQLITITHNRETMSRAGILYGVTMGQDGISKLLSVRFEEALAVAK